MTLEVSFPGGVKVNVTYKGFTTTTDQSKADGGENTAPNPFDLFLISVASCAGYFALTYCTKRKLPTDGLKVSMEPTFDGGRNVVSVAIKVTPPKDFPEGQKEALLRSVAACKVKKHLENPPKFEVELA
ncbi:OsmC-like protein [uncultured archaeon]|nr:OsmC-like protein [uncultured archaeon]